MLIYAIVLIAVMLAVNNAALMELIEVTKNKLLRRTDDKKGGAGNE